MECSINPGEVARRLATHFPRGAVAMGSNVHVLIGDALP
jgi:hypothetical protein